LRAELSDEVQFLNEVDGEALHYGMEDDNLPESGGLERSDESSVKSKKPAHVVPSLQKMLSRKEIMGKPSSGENKRDLSVQGKGYIVETLPELSAPNVLKKSVTLDLPSSPAPSTQKADDGMDDTNLIQEKTAGKGTVSSDEISDNIHRNLRQRMDELIDWVELLDSVPDISAGSEVTTSPSSEMSPKSHTTIWSTSTSAEGRTKTTLPLIRPDVKPSVESIKSKASTRLLKKAKEASCTPTSLSSSSLRSGSGGRTSPLLDVVAKTDSLESILCEPPLNAIPGQRLDEISQSKATTSPYGTWAYTVSAETPSSEFTDRILSDENAELEPRRPVKKCLRDSVVTVSPFEVAEHIANVLEAIMD
uniref:SCAPER_N domain-containing protein n=1 Tax=Hydatigena taeniaeformis TaxID=6205 RepID=A0A0R3WQR1_HYDTA